MSNMMCLGKIICIFRIKLAETEEQIHISGRHRKYLGIHFLDFPLIRSPPKQPGVPEKYRTRGLEDSHCALKNAGAFKEKCEDVKPMHLVGLMYEERGALNRYPATDLYMGRDGQL